MTSSQPLTSNPDGKAVVGSLEGPVPVVRLYGVTKNGKSVMATVHGFTPYLYVSAPQGADISDQSLGILRTTLDQKMREKARGNEKNCKSFVLGIEKAENKQVLTHSLTHSLTYSPTHLLTYSPTHLLTYSPTHLLTHLLRVCMGITSVPPRHF